VAKLALASRTPSSDSRVSCIVAEQLAQDIPVMSSRVRRVLIAVLDYGLPL
jgi:hypothetical protein